MNGRLVLVALVLILASSAVDCQSDGVGEWKILIKQNFSSQIRLHPHILLLVTVPWSGESRSLMKELAHLVTDRQKEFRYLKLRYMYGSTEKMLADSIGSTEGTTILYYHHSISYKYQGRLRAQNILHSVYPYKSVLPEELPLEPLNSAEDLKMFLESTDKALILLEFCGWTPRLLAKGRKNGTENVSGLQGDIFGTGFNGETDGMPAPRGKHNQKGMENERPKCGIKNGFSEIPWLGEFSSINESTAFQQTENANSGVGLSCTFEEFQRFDSFFAKFMTVAREFFLPLEKHRFGLVSERSLLSSLGIGDSGSWLSMLYITGCPGCSKILKEGDDLKIALQMDNSIVVEMEVDGQDLEPALPANKPSILLFVDRFSGSSEIRKKGKEALDAFRQLALDCQISHQMGLQNKDQPEKSSVQVYQELKSTSAHPRLKLSPTSQKIKLKDKMSIMIMNEGKHISLENIASDLQGSTLHEALSYLLEKKKEAKLSSLAKEVGFHLLSGDFDIKAVDASPSQTEVQSNKVFPLVSEEGLVSSIGDLDKDQSPYRESISDVEHDEKSKPTDVEPSSHYEEEKAISAETNKQLISVEPDQLVPNTEPAMDGDVKVKGKRSSQADKLGGQQFNVQGFKGSFFFCEGNYRLLTALTGGSTMPSLVLIDPILQQHYAFTEETIFSYNSLVDFLHGYLNGSLLPYQRSESVTRSRREATHPPFVNLDFHEMDSIPRVTTRTFSELVLGLNQSDTENAAHAWSQDVLVLFSSSWCGFCQRMELVVREVYRAIKGYVKMLKSGSRDVQTMFTSDEGRDALLKLPLIYLMDCTLNDCSLILKSINQREVYPTLLLFPAKRKNAVSYEGDMAVADVIKFMADHGSSSHHLIGEKGILWILAEDGSGNQNLFRYLSPSAIQEEAPVAKDKFHEVLLKNRAPKRVHNYNQINSHSSKGLHEMAAHVVIGSILFATDKLINAHPFDNSKIVIIKADQDSGFQGLIFNKRIRWDSLHELEEGLEFLKDAPLHFGGPLRKRGMPLVALTRRVIKDQFPEVLPGLYFLDQLATIDQIEELKSENQSTTDYWFFLGYSSWGWNQLLDEIAEGAWNISNPNMGYLDWPSS